jgi:hypothetical protein
MATVAACLFLAGLIGYWVFTADEESQHDVGREARLLSLREKKQTVYDNLKDLHFEYLAGKLSDEDYHRSRRMLEGEAATVTAELELAGDRG